MITTKPNPLPSRQGLSSWDQTEPPPCALSSIKPGVGGDSFSALQQCPEVPWVSKSLRTRQPLGCPSQPRCPTAQTALPHPWSFPSPGTSLQPTTHPATVWGKHSQLPVPCLPQKPSPVAEGTWDPQPYIHDIILIGDISICDQKKTLV